MGAPTVGQAAALAALSTAAVELPEILRQLFRNRGIALEGFQAAGLKVLAPEAGPFLWIDVNNLGANGDTIAAAWGQERQVFVTPGSRFGFSGRKFVRASFATDEEGLVDAVKRIHNWTLGRLDDRSGEGR
jgi:aspartate/methionine/tyrosine aminotransferase